MALPEPVKQVLRDTRRSLKNLDKTVNYLTGGAKGETISARMARLKSKGVFIGCVICRFLDIFQKNHCEKALANETRNPGVP